jgi:hypothetical protein
LVKVRISSPAIRLVKPSNTAFNSSNNMLATVTVVAIQNWSRYTSAPTR